MDKETIIEERDPKEVLGDHKVPDNVKIFNPVFDHTDAGNITSFITEEGLIAPSDVKEISMKHFGESE